HRIFAGAGSESIPQLVPRRPERIPGFQLQHVGGSAIAAAAAQSTAASAKPADDAPTASNLGASRLQRARVQGRVSHRASDGVPVYGALLPEAAAPSEEAGAVA